MRAYVWVCVYTEVLGPLVTYVSGCLAYQLTLSLILMIMQLALIHLFSLNQILGDMKLRKIWRLKKKLKKTESNGILFILFS